MKVTVYEHVADLPDLLAGSYFHSRELMELCEHTSFHRAYMAVVTDDDGRVKANLLAVERFHRSWLPPYLYSHVRVLGDGIYEGNHDEKVFNLMLQALTRRLQAKTLYIEFSHLSQKMFGYRQLRHAGYFPVRWMNIHNSLHSRLPEERINQRQLQRIEAAIARGVTTRVVERSDDFDACMKLLHQHLRFKPRRYLPDDDFFRLMQQSGHCKIFMTEYHSKIIGCSVCLYSDDDAYLWYSAAKRKSYATLHPNAVTVWNTIRYVHSEGIRHIRFVDVGLPFRRNPYRDFILRFGGKEVSGYRWFRISIRWVNRLASWLWRE